MNFGIIYILVVKTYDESRRVRLFLILPSIGQIKISGFIFWQGFRFAVLEELVEPFEGAFGSQLDVPLGGRGDTSMYLPRPYRAPS